MNEKQKTILKNWLKDNHYLIDGILLHRGTANAIAVHFHESETGRNQRFWCETSDICEAMLDLGYAPTSQKENCSFIPSVESVTPQRMAAMLSALETAANELGQWHCHNKFVEHLRDLLGGHIPLEGQHLKETK